MEPVEDLGPIEVWQIREFPRGLRQYLADEARVENVKVGELLTRIVLAYRDGHKTPFANVSNSGDDLAAVERLARVARLLTDEGKTTKALEMARRVVVSRLQMLDTNAVLKPSLSLTHQPKAESDEAVSGMPLEQ